MDWRWILSQNRYQELLKDDESLKIFLNNIREFDQAFCDMMTGCKDFTLRLEVRGDKGKLVWCRLSRDYFDKPPQKEKN
jgi:hypothetical protein